MARRERSEPLFSSVPQGRFDHRPEASAPANVAARRFIRFRVAQRRGDNGLRHGTGFAASLRDAIQKTNALSAVCRG